MTDFLEERLETAEVRSCLPGEHTASGSTGAPLMALPVGIVLNFFLFLTSLNNMEPGSSNRENIIMKVSNTALCTRCFTKIVLWKYHFLTTLWGCKVIIDGYTFVKVNKLCTRLQWEILSINGLHVSYYYKCGYYKCAGRFPLTVIFIPVMKYLFWELKSFKKIVSVYCWFLNSWTKILWSVKNQRTKWITYSGPR